MNSFVSGLMRRLISYYFTKPRKFHYDDLEITVFPDVFYPQFTKSTKLIMNFINQFDLSEKKVLELGCGCSAISMLAAKKGAQVLATDISSIAIKNCQFNSKTLNHRVRTIQSDLFDSIEKETFDFIIINPPYYPKKPVYEKDFAWFCGEDHQYFKKLFKQLRNYLDANTQVIMILSDHCNIELIKSIATEQQFNLNCQQTTRIFGENNFIYKIENTDV